MQIFGEIGVLADDGEKVQCHICGRWFVTLQSHLRHKHGIDVRDYKMSYELNATQPLCSKRHTEKMSTIQTPHLLQFAGMNKDAQRESALRQRGQTFKMRKQGRAKIKKIASSPESRATRSAVGKLRWENDMYPLKVYVTSPDFKVKRQTASRRPRNAKGVFLKATKPASDNSNVQPECQSEPLQGQSSVPKEHQD